MGIANTLAMIRMVPAFLTGESAATTTEYALIAGGVAIAIVTVLINTGGTLNKFFVMLSTAFR
jgi:pilus assembly protein Flp/PilA